jgi:hypothetical protein
MVRGYVNYPNPLSVARPTMLTKAHVCVTQFHHGGIAIHRNLLTWVSA